MKFNIASNSNGVIYDRMIRPLAFADDIDLLARRRNDLEEVYITFRDAAEKLGLKSLY